MIQDWQYVVPVEVEENATCVEIYDSALQKNVLKAQFYFSIGYPNDPPEIKLVRGPGAPADMTDVQLEEYARVGLE